MKNWWCLTGEWRKAITYLLLVDFSCGCRDITHISSLKVRIHAIFLMGIYSIHSMLTKIQLGWKHPPILDYSVLVVTDLQYFVLVHVHVCDNLQP